MVSDTTRRCRFLSTVIKKPRCTSNSREKGLKNPNEDYNGRLMLAQSEITTLLDSNTDFESVADSIYDGSLKKFGHGKTKGIEPPVFNNKKERNLSHEKYEPMDQGLKTEEKKTLECDDFIEVKRKKSLKDTGGYITSSACKPSLLKAGNQKKLEKNGGMGKKNINNNNVINNNKNIIRSNNNINSSNVKYNSISINSNNNNEKTIINNKIDKSIGNTINNEKNNNPIDKNIRNSINNDKNTININNNEKNITSDKTINNIINNEKIINNNDKSKNIINNESNNIISLERINISINNEKNNINEKNQKTNTKNIINTTNNYIINEEKPIMNNVNKVLLIEQKLSKEISLFIEGMRPKIEELRILRGLVLKRLRFILACLFPRKFIYNELKY